MSRTDNTTPLWVLAQRTENIASYDHRCHRRFFGNKRLGSGHWPCDGGEPVNQHSYQLCRPTFDYDLGWEYCGCYGWVRHHNGSRADSRDDRPGTRDQLRNLVKAARAGEDTDDSHLFNRQPRHRIDGFWAYC